MKIIKKLKAILLRQKPMDEDQILAAYMTSLSNGIKPAPLFARDFVRTVERHHGIGNKKEVAFRDEESIDTTILR